MMIFNITCTILILLVFVMEVILIFLEKPDKDVVKDLKTNFLLGLFILITGLFMKVVDQAYALPCRFTIR